MQQKSYTGNKVIKSHNHIMQIYDIATDSKIQTKNNLKMFFGYNKKLNFSSRTLLQVRTFLFYFPACIEFVLLSCFLFHAHIYICFLCPHIAGVFFLRFFPFFIFGVFSGTEGYNRGWQQYVLHLHNSARNQKQKKHRQLLQHHHLFEKSLSITLYHNLLFLLFIFSCVCCSPIFTHFRLLIKTRRGKQTWAQNTLSSTCLTCITKQINVICLLHHTLIIFTWSFASQHTHPQLLYSIHLWLSITRLLGNNNDSDLLEISGICPTSGKEYSTHVRPQCLPQPTVWTMEMQ